MVQKYFLIAISSLFLLACSSGKKSLEQGNYDQAVYQAVKRLKQKPQHKKASAVLQEAYVHAIDRHMEQIKRYDKSNAGDKWERMAEEYERINYLNSVIRSYPEYMDLVELVDVTDAVASTRSAAAEELYERGMMFLEKGTKESARLAYDEFVNADYYKPGDQDIISKMMESKEAGTVNIAFHFTRRGTQDFFLPTDDLFYDLQRFARTMNYTFLRVVDIQDDRSVDEIIEVEFDQIIIGNVFMDRKQHHIIKDDVLIGKAQVNDSTEVDVYGKVEADFRTYKKTMESRGALYIRHLNAITNTTLNTFRFPSTFHWTAEWATYRGDKRALSKEQLELARLEEPLTPSPDWIFARLCEPIYSDASNALRREFRHLR